MVGIEGQFTGGPSLTWPRAQGGCPAGGSICATRGGGWPRCQEASCRDGTGQARAGQAESGGTGPYLFLALEDLGPKLRMWACHRLTTPRPLPHGLVPTRGERGGREGMLEGGGEEEGC